MTGACWKSGQTTGGIWSISSSCLCAVQKKPWRSSRRNSELFFARMNGPAEPGQQGGQLRTVLLAEGREFQSQANPRFCVPHDGVCPDLPFLHQKIQSGQNAFRLWLGSLNEQSSHAHIPHAGDVLAPLRS